jgi:hypothetical protein
MSRARGYYDPRLVTRVERLEYDYRTGTGRLYMPPHCCTDMTAAIKLFKAIHPRVRRIETFAGEEPDVRYEARGMKWRAVDPTGRADRPWVTIR